MVTAMQRTVLQIQTGGSFDKEARSETQADAIPTRVPSAPRVRVFVRGVPARGPRTAPDMNKNRRLNETVYGGSCGFRSVSLI